jgi:hypothetical protein
LFPTFSNLHAGPLRGNGLQNYGKKIHLLQSILPVEETK